MPIDWKKFAADELPKLALTLLAAKSAGPGAAASFLRGLEQGKGQRAQQARQQALDQQQATYQQAQLANLERDDVRQDETNAYNRFLQAYQQLQTLAPQLVESSPDETTATSALAGHQTALEQAAKLQPGALGPATANVPQLVSGKQKRQARDLLENLEKQKVYAGIVGTPEFEEMDVPFAGRRVKVSELRASAGLQLQQAGQPVTPSLKPPSEGVPTTEKRALEAYARELGKTPDTLTSEELLRFRKIFAQADDRPNQATVVIQTVDAQGKPITQIVPRTVGATYQAAPTTAERERQSAKLRLIPAIEQMEQLGQKIITTVGPAQRAQAIARGWDAVLGNDPEYRTYQDARVALAGNLAVAQQGSRPSDADIRAVWLPLIPDVFRDTKESAAMKWQMIRTNMSLPTTGGNQAIEDALKAQGITGKVVGVREKKP